MNDDVRLSKLTGIVLILMPIAFNVFFTLLSVTFEYPDILREPASYVLRSFEAGGSGLVAIWYGFTLTAVLFVPLVVLVHKVLARQDTPYMAVATTFGVVAGVVQFLGLIRWPFLVPYLADVYLDPDRVGRAGHVWVSAAVQEVAESVRDGVGCRRTCRDPRTGRVRGSRKHSGSRVRPLVDLARPDRHIPLTYQVQSAPSTSDQPGR
jgi:Domain of unknown function (DUF4386)